MHRIDNRNKNKSIEKNIRKTIIETSTSSLSLIIDGLPFLYANEELKSIGAEMVKIYSNTKIRGYRHIKFGDEQMVEVVRDLVNNGWEIEIEQQPIKQTVG
jgi:hypothetical protein